MTTMMNTIEEEDYQLLLPDEITTEILSRLPAESLMQCKLVCKTWRALIVDPNFIYMYTRHYSLKHTTTTAAELEWLSFPRKVVTTLQFVKYSGCDDHNKNPIIKQAKPIIYYPHSRVGMKRMRRSSSCHGLIFMTTLANQMFVYNPFTKEYVDLPPIRFNNHHGSWMKMATGFGYHSSTNEYKVIIIYYYGSNSKRQLTIYTLGNGGGWRDKGEISHKVSDRSMKPAGGVLFNGALHWLTEKKYEIVSFDLANEEFRIVPSPPPLPYSYLGLLGGCLCVTGRGIGGYLGLWVMDSMDEYSWSKKFNISWKSRLSSHRPLALLESGKILLHSSGERLISYDPETESSIVVGESELLSVFTYTKTIVSLKAIGETDATIFDPDATILDPDDHIDSDLIKKRKRNSDSP